MNGMAVEQQRKKNSSSSSSRARDREKCEEYTNQMKHIATLLCSVRCECVCFSESDFDSCCCFYCVFLSAGFSRTLQMRMCVRVWFCYAIHIERMDRELVVIQRTAAASTFTHTHTQAHADPNKHAHIRWRRNGNEKGEHGCCESRRISRLFFPLHPTPFRSSNSSSSGAQWCACTCDFARVCICTDKYAGLFISLIHHVCQKIVLGQVHGVS